MPPLTVFALANSSCRKSARIGTTKNVAAPGASTSAIHS
jgi:hypothetical protein